MRRQRMTCDGRKGRKEEEKWQTSPKLENYNEQKSHTVKRKK